MVVDGFAEGIGSGQIGLKKGAHTLFTHLTSTELKILTGESKFISFLEIGNLNYQYNYRLPNDHYVFASAGFGLIYHSKSIENITNYNNNYEWRPNVTAGYKFKIGNGTFVTARMGVHPTCVDRYFPSLRATPSATFVVAPLSFLIGVGN